MTASRRSNHTSSARVSRRSVMRAAAGTSLGLGLASLGANGSIAQDDATPADGLTFDFSGSGIELPTDDLTFRWLNSGPGPKGVFLAMMFEAYQQAHSNITVEYDQLPWNEIAKVVPLGIRSGNAHDVFQVPTNVPDAQAVAEGWVAPLDDLIPNFEEWKAGFPPGSFINGFTDFGGKTYTFPVSSSRRYGTLLLYNRPYMDEAGLDPNETPFTWDQFRDAAKKLTEQGDGNYYGLIFEGNQTGRFAEFVGNLARMAGASATDDIDWRTGEYVYTSDEYIAAIELLLAIRDDGSVFPGSLALNAHEARARMPQGVAAMILQGPWNIPTWQRDAPDYNFGVASQPVPNEGDPLPLTVGPGGSNAFYIYAESPYKAVAADVFHYLGTHEGQSNWGKIVGIADPPVSPEALAAANLDERSTRAAELFQEQIRLGPDPRVRNPEAAQVYLERQTITPDFGETVQGLFAEALDMDVKTAMQDLQDRSEAELERAIKAAQDKGAEVSRDDWVFPNWDPTQDYLPEDYDAL